MVFPSSRTAPPANNTTNNQSDEPDFNLDDPDDAAAYLRRVNPTSDKDVVSSSGRVVHMLDDATQYNQYIGDFNKYLSRVQQHSLEFMADGYRARLKDYKDKEDFINESKSTRMYRQMIMLMCAEPLSQNISLGNVIETAAAFFAAAKISPAFRQDLASLRDVGLETIKCNLEAKYGAAPSKDAMPTMAQYMAEPEGFDNMQRACKPMGMLYKAVTKAQKHFSSAPTQVMSVDEVAMKEIAINWAGYQEIMSYPTTAPDFAAHSLRVQANVTEAVQSMRAVAIKDANGAFTQSDIDNRFNVILSTMAAENSPICQAFDGIMDGKVKADEPTIQRCYDVDGNAHDLYVYEGGMQQRDSKGVYHPINRPGFNNPAMHNYVPGVAQAKLYSVFDNTMSRMDDLRAGAITPADAAIVGNVMRYATASAVFDLQMRNYVVRDVNDEAYTKVPGAARIDDSGAEAPIDNAALSKHINDQKNAIKTIYQAICEAAKPQSEDSKRQALNTLVARINDFNEQMGKSFGSANYENTRRGVDFMIDDPATHANACMMPDPYINVKMGVFDENGNPSEHVEPLQIPAVIPLELAQDSKMGDALRDMFLNAYNINHETAVLGMTPNYQNSDGVGPAAFATPTDFARAQASMDEDVAQIWQQNQADARPQYMHDVFGVDLNAEQTMRVRAAQTARMASAYSYNNAGALGIDPMAGAGSGSNA